jgi:hypothetical protein
MQHRLQKSTMDDRGPMSQTIAYGEKKAVQIPQTQAPAEGRLTYLCRSASAHSVLFIELVAKGFSHFAPPLNNIAQHIQIASLLPKRVRVTQLTRPNRPLFPCFLSFVDKTATPRSQRPQSIAGQRVDEAHTPSQIPDSWAPGVHYPEKQRHRRRVGHLGGCFPATCSLNTAAAFLDILCSFQQQRIELGGDRNAAEPVARAASA